MKARRQKGLIEKEIKQELCYYKENEKDWSAYLETIDVYSGTETDYCSICREYLAFMLCSCGLLCFVCYEEHSKAECVLFSLNGFSREQNVE